MKVAIAFSLVILIKASILNIPYAHAIMTCPISIFEVADEVGGDAEYWRFAFVTTDGNEAVLTISFLYFGPETILTAPPRSMLIELYQRENGSYAGGNPYRFGESMIAEAASLFCSNIQTPAIPSTERFEPELSVEDVAYWCIPEYACRDSLFQGDNQQEVRYESAIPMDFIVPDRIRFVNTDSSGRTHTGLGPMVIHNVVDATFTLIPR